jgi:hypothetical protein
VAPTPLRRLWDRVRVHRSAPDVAANCEADQRLGTDEYRRSDRSRKRRIRNSLKEERQGGPVRLSNTAIVPGPHRRWTQGAEITRAASDVKFWVKYFLKLLVISYIIMRFILYGTRVLAYYFVHREWKFF